MDVAPPVPYIVGSRPVYDDGSSFNVSKVILLVLRARVAVVMN